MNKQKDTRTVVLSILILMATIIVIIYSCSDESDSMSYVGALTVLGIFLIGAAVGLIMNSIRQKKQQKKAAAEHREEPESLGEDKLDIIIEEIKRRTAKPAYRIKAEKCDELGIAQSKFGGYPYWKTEDPYPLDSHGNAMYLLAQINFSEIPAPDPLLPREGILQFFISDDVYCGAGFDSDSGGLADQRNFRVVYHADIDSSVTEESVKAQNIKAFSDEPDNDCFPLTTQEKLTFEKFTDYVLWGMDECSKIVDEILYDEFGMEFTDGRVCGTFNYADYKYIQDAFEGLWCSKILGYPEFTQNDPRVSESDYEYYDTVLLQIDSDDEIMWGDCGIANFLINSQALKDHDFSNVLYNWDCY